MFKRLSFKAQLAGGFALVVAGFAITLLIIAGLLGRLEHGIQRVSDQSLPQVLAVDQMNMSRSEVQQFLTDVSATHDPAAYEEAATAARQFHEAAQLIAKALEQDHDTARLEQLRAIQVNFDAFYASGQRMAETYLRDGMEAGNLLMKGTEGKPGFDQASTDVSELLTKFREDQLQRSHQDTVDDLTAADAIQATMLWGGLAATVLALVLAALIVRVMLVQLGGEPREAVTLVRRVGAGDLATPIELRAGDSTSLMAHLRAMQGDLLRVVATVRQKAQSVAGASSEIESGNGDLATRTASQASSLEETSASMEELNTKVKQNVDGAKHASELAVAASTAAARGGELVAQFVDTMQSIDQASRKITDILGLIDEIAFQTNILALNAAVEAARAGEQGRGFAVVASEVRSLAGRSAEAARSIKALIGNSAERVAEGSALGSKARAAMTDVVEGIRRVSETMTHITAASAEQGVGVAEITEAVTRMDAVTQENAALVEMCANAAASLRMQAQELMQSVAVFKLGAAERIEGAASAATEQTREQFQLAA